MGDTSANNLGQILVILGESWFNPGFIGAETASALSHPPMSEVSITIPPDDRTNPKLRQPNAAQVAFLLEASIGGKVPSDLLGDLVRFYGFSGDGVSVATIGSKGQNATELGKAFLEIKSFAETQGHDAYLAVATKDLAKYLQNPALLNTNPPANADQIRAALTYIHYQGNVHSNQSAETQAFLQKTDDVIREFQTGGLFSSEAGLGAVNSGIATLNFVLNAAIKGSLPASTGALIPNNLTIIGDVDTGATTAGGQARATLGFAGGSVAQIFITPGSLVKVIGLGKSAILSADTVNAFRAADDAVIIASHEAEVAARVEAATISGKGRVANTAADANPLLRPNVDMPNGPASSATNAERLRADLTARQLADVNRATSEIANIRSNVPLSNPNRLGNVTVADVNIAGVADTRLAAHSQVNRAQPGLVGRGGQNFTFTSESLTHNP